MTLKLVLDITAMEKLFNEEQLVEFELAARKRMESLILERVKENYKEDFGDYIRNSVDRIGKGIDLGVKRLLDGKPDLKMSAELTALIQNEFRKEMAIYSKQMEDARAEQIRSINAELERVFKLCADNAKVNVRTMIQAEISQLSQTLDGTIKDLAYSHFMQVLRDVKTQVQTF